MLLVIRFWAGERKFLFFFSHFLQSFTVYIFSFLLFCFSCSLLQVSANSSIGVALDTTGFSHSFSLPLFQENGNVVSATVREEEKVVSSSAGVCTSSSSTTLDPPVCPTTASPTHVQPSPPTAVHTSVSSIGGSNEGVREVRPPKLQSFKNIMDRMSPEREGGPHSPTASPDKVWNV